MTNTALVAGVSAGGLIGAGTFVIVTQLAPAPPALGPALRRLHPAASRAAPSPAGWLRRHFTVPHTDLRLLDRSTDEYFRTLGVSALVGLLLPTLMAVAVLLLRLPISPVIPAGLSIVVAAASAWSSHRQMLARAAAARQEFTRAVCTFLDLTAHQVLGGHGPVESLDRATGTCHGWPFLRIRRALLRAQLQMRPPWDELRALSREISVVELGDLADIMSTAGREGADVYHTLRARADSLRDRLRTDALADAEVKTNKLDIPASALILIVLVVLGFPFLSRLITP